MFLIFFLVHLLISLSPKNICHSDYFNLLLKRFSKQTENTFSLTDLPSLFEFRVTSFESDWTVNSRYVICRVDLSHDTFIKEFKIYSVLSEGFFMWTTFLLQNQKNESCICERLHLEFEEFCQWRFLERDDKTNCVLLSMFYKIFEQKISPSIFEWIHFQTQNEQKIYLKTFNRLRDLLNKKEKCGVEKHHFRNIFYQEDVIPNKRSSFLKLIFLGEYLDSLGFDSNVFFGQHYLTRETYEDFKYQLLSLFFYYDVTFRIKDQMLLIKKLENKGSFLLLEKIMVLIKGAVGLFPSHSKIVHSVLSLQQEASLSIVPQKGFYCYINEKSSKHRLHFVYLTEFRKNNMGVCDIFGSQIYFTKAYFSPQKAQLDQIIYQVLSATHLQKQLFLKKYLKILINELQKFHKEHYYHQDLFGRNLLIDFKNLDFTQVCSLFLIDLDNTKKALEGYDGSYLDAICFVEILFLLFDYDMWHRFHLNLTVHTFLDYFLYLFSIEEYLSDPSLILFFLYLKRCIYSQRMTQDDLDQLLSFLNSSDLPLNQVQGEKLSLWTMDHLQKKVLRGRFFYELNKVSFDNLYFILRFVYILKGVRYQPVFLKKDESQGWDEHNFEIESDDIFRYSLSFLMKTRQQNNVLINPFCSLISILYSQEENPQFVSEMIPRVQSIRCGLEFFSTQVTFSNSLEVFAFLMQTVHVLNRRELLYVDAFQVEGLTVYSINAKRVMRNYYGYLYNIYLVVEWIVKTYYPLDEQDRYFLSNQPFEQVYLRLLFYLDQLVDSHQKKDSVDSKLVQDGIFPWVQKLVPILKKPSSKEIHLDHIHSLAKDVYQLTINRTFYSSSVLTYL